MTSSVSINDDLTSSPLIKSTTSKSTLSNKDEGPANTNSPYTINDLISKVDSLMDTCDYELALKFCLRALSLDPNSTKVLEILGVNEIELEMFEEAKEVFIHLFKNKTRRKKAESIKESKSI
ncbi:14514_t:CDS:1 [Entrophospora sp. SA101]|nr:14514_t:CDS:1 [Entrophospora sp. SA101]